MKIVMDNKIWVAYLLSKDARVERILDLVSDEKITLLMSKDLLEDLTTLLKIDQINQQLDNKLIENFLTFIIQKSEIVNPTQFVENKTSSKDLPYANLVASANAQFLITTKNEFYRFSKLDGYKLLNVIELNIFIENINLD